MTSTLAFAPRAVQQQVFRIVRQHRHGRGQRLSRGLRLMHELCFDLLDIVDIILDLEHCFHITIPDEVPFVTVGDFVDYVVAETQRFIRFQRHPAVGAGTGCVA